MLGGGVFVTQNKTLPGSYINFVSAARATSAMGERGTVAIALPLNHAVGEVIELNRRDFISDCKTLLGVEYGDDSVAPIRELFCNAQKVYVYDLGSDKGVDDAIDALEAYEFNIVCAYTDDSEDITKYITAIKYWRDEIGKKCQVVVYNTDGQDHEGVINVVSNVSDEGAPAYALVAWVAGAEAGCAVNKSCTNMRYNGAYNIVCNKTQKQLEACLTAGQFTFHLVYGNVRVLEDINSLTETSEDKGEDFKSNQTIRVIDQIANDIAKLFNTKYIGSIPNNKAGRCMFWNDIVEHHRELEQLQAIEGFDTSLLSVEQGKNKKSVVVNDCVTVVNAMSQLYMTVVVQ